jgi:hypothetical protein
LGEKGRISDKKVLVGENGRISDKKVLVGGERENIR